MYSNWSESNLIKNAKNGSRLAFDELFRRQQNYLFNLMYQLCGDIATADDMTQEAFLRVYQKLGSFRLESSIRTWLTRIAINLFLHHKRKKPELDPLILEEIRIPSQDACPERVVIKREIQWCIHHTLQYYVPEKFRIVLVLRELQNFSYQEIAQALKLTIPNVKTRLHRARNCLKELFMHPQSPCRGFIKEYRCTCDGILEVGAEMQ